MTTGSERNERDKRKDVRRGMRAPIIAESGDRWTELREERVLARAVRHYLGGVERRTGRSPRWKMGSLPWSELPDGERSTLVWHGQGVYVVLRAGDETATLLAVYRVMRGDSLRRLALRWPPAAMKLDGGAWSPRIRAGARRLAGDPDEYRGSWPPPERERGERGESADVPKANKPDKGRGRVIAEILAEEQGRKRY